MSAWHNEPQLKAAIIKRLRKQSKKELIKAEAFKNLSERTAPIGV